MAIILTWSNHSRAGQSDTLVAWRDGSTGQEANERRALQVRDSGGVLLAEKLDIATDAESATVETDQTGTLHFKLWSIRDGFDSWQPNEWTSEHPVADAVTGTIIIATGYTGLPAIPNQPHGEPLVASNIAPPVLLTSSDGTDFVYSS